MVIRNLNTLKVCFSVNHHLQNITDNKLSDKRVLSTRVSDSRQFRLTLGTIKSARSRKVRKYSVNSESNRENLLCENNCVGNANVVNNMAFNKSDHVSAFPEGLIRRFLLSCR